MYIGERVGMMQNNIIIGLTGTSGSGKSSVSKILKEYGFKILDCDAIAHKNMETTGVAYKDIVAGFGNEILNPDMTINRKILGSIVFNNRDKLKKLNDITHKHISDYLISEIENTDENIVIDAPLLYEAGLDRLCHKVWAVVCDDNIRLERVMKRDNISAQSALDRFKNQKTNSYFEEKADIVLDNSYDEKNIRERVIYEINKISH